MPEEINRILTDAIAELLLVSEPSGAANLNLEGVKSAKVRLVGNVMIDTLMHELTLAKKSHILEQLELTDDEYAIMTMHRPSNVDDPTILKRLLEVIRDLSSIMPIVFPIHPRTRQAAAEAGVTDLLFKSPGLRCIDPVSYRNNLWLMANARLVLTDSGGMQEETTFLKVPCLTLRENTERPITVERGTSRLVGNEPEQIRNAFEDVLAGRWQKGEAIPLWDGHASERVAKEICLWI